MSFRTIDEHSQQNNLESPPTRILGAAMARSESIEKQLSLWKVAEDDGDEVQNRLFTAFAKLPKNLKTIALAVFDINEKGLSNEDDDDDDDDDEDRSDQKREAALKKQRELHAQF